MRAAQIQHMSAGTRRVVHVYLPGFTQTYDTPLDKDPVDIGIDIGIDIRHRLRPDGSRYTYTYAYTFTDTSTHMSIYIYVYFFTIMTLDIYSSICSSDLHIRIASIYPYTFGGIHRGARGAHSG